MLAAMLMYGGQSVINSNQRTQQAVIEAIENLGRINMEKHYNLINQLIAMFGNIETLIGAATGAIVAAILLYQKIKRCLAEKKSLTSIVGSYCSRSEQAHAGAKRYNKQAY